jgi:hypothetical protein
VSCVGHVKVAAFSKAGREGRRVICRSGQEKMKWSVTCSSGRDGCHILSRTHWPSCVGQEEMAVIYMRRQGDYLI